MLPLRTLTAWEPSGTIDQQRDLVEGVESGLEPVKECDVPAIDQDLDVPPEPALFKQELLERGAHDLPQRFQELPHRPGIDSK